MTNKGEILVIDDTAASLQMLSAMLAGGGYSVRLAESGELAISAAESKPPELFLLDVRMPGLDGFEVFRRLKAKPATSEIPVIFLTASSDPEDCVAGLKLGAVDFITKPFDREGLLAKVGTHVELFRLRKKLEQQALELSAERDRFSALFNNSNDAVFLYGIEPGGLPGKFIEVNDAACSRLGYSREELLALTPADIDASDMDEKRRAALEELTRSGSAVFEMSHSSKDGRRIISEISSRVFRCGGQLCVLSIARDITERLKLETKLRQTQRMETVGLLAGGVAHDFNNILSAIMCYAGFLARDLAPGDPKQGDVKEILTAAGRAASLTRQLLAFSRRQIMATRVADLNELMGGMTSLLERVIGEEIKIEMKLFPAPCTASVDVGQMEQVIMNLVLNARDAMPRGGTITLETEIINPPEEFFDTRPDLVIGPLVCLKVADTGCGMGEEVKRHLFEPFFTTKEQGKGTGLGLSTVFGIVKQSRGEIEAESGPGKGAAFTIYLPLEEAPPADTDKDKAGELPGKGHETVLFVEDEESLRRLGERVLRSSGYTVLAAADGQAALKLMEERGRPVDLLMTDVVMPGMSGRDLGLELARRKLIGRALYMSGYTDDAIVKHGVLEQGIAFIYKPFTVDAVLLKLREVLDGPADKAKA